jgi:hypothetical protein
MELGEQLLDACLNDVDHATQLLFSHSNDRNLLNWKDSKNQYSILHILVYRGAAIPLGLLLNTGANPNIINKVR